MISFPTATKRTLIEGGKVEIEVYVKVGNSTPVEIPTSKIITESFIINRTSVSGTTLEIGNAIAAQLSFSFDYEDLELYADDFDGAEITVYANDVKIGVFYVDTVEYQDEIMNVIALDAMVKFDKVVNDSSFLTPEKNIGTYIGRICQACGVTYDSTHSDTYTIPYDTAVPTTSPLTYRQLLMWACQLIGDCAYINSNGELSVNYYYDVENTPGHTPETYIDDNDQTVYVNEITPSVRFSSTLGKGITVTGVMAAVGTQVYTRGSMTYPINLTGNEFVNADNVEQFLISASRRLNPNSSGLCNFPYSPFSAASMPLIWLQPFDAVTFITKSGGTASVAITDWTFSLSDYLQLQGKGDTNTQKSYAELMAFTAQQAAAISEIEQTAEDAMSDAADALDAAADAAEAASDAADAADAAQAAASSASTAAADAASAAASASTAANAATGYATSIYGTCDTAASTSEKVVICSGFTLFNGATINVKFTNANSTLGVTSLNVNSTGGKYVRVFGNYLAPNDPYNWSAGSIVQFVYDGTDWLMSEIDALKAIGNWSYGNTISKIDGAKIFNGTVGADQLMAESVTAEKIAAGQINTSHLASASAFINALMANSIEVSNGDISIYSYMGYATEETKVRLRLFWKNLLFPTVIDYDHLTAAQKETVEKAVKATILAINYFDGAKFKCLAVDEYGTETGYGASMTPFGVFVTDGSRTYDDAAVGTKYGYDCNIVGDFSVDGLFEVGGVDTGTTVNYGSGWQSITSFDLGESGKDCTYLVIVTVYFESRGKAEFDACAVLTDSSSSPSSFSMNDGVSQRTTVGDNSTTPPTGLNTVLKFPKLVSTSGVETFYVHARHYYPGNIGIQARYQATKISQWNT